MDIYRRELKGYRPGFITGRETDRQKDEAARAFMAGETDLLCLSLRSASGLNLQRASCVVFGELDWSPAVHSQAEDRAHRIGQQDSLLCYYLVSPRGSDRDMQDALVGVQPQGEFRYLLHRLMDMGFDDILTTNYSYELERASFPKELDSAKTCGRVRRIQATTAERAEPRYMLHTFNRAGESRRA